MGKIGSGFEDRVKSIGETMLKFVLWKSKAGSMTKADEDVAGGDEVERAGTEWQQLPDYGRDRRLER